jgi:preprotein translocase subunit SecG
MRTKIPALARVVVCLASIFFVLCVMLLCSVWSGFVSPDPNSSQIYWLKMSNIIALPTKIFPVELPGGFQFLVTFLFWVTVVYLACSFSIGLLISFFGRRSGRKGIKEPIKPCVATGDNVLL